MLPEKIALLLVEGLCLGFRVAAGVLGVASVELEFDELCSDTLYLLANGCPGVVCRGNGAEPLCGPESLEPGNAGSDNDSYIDDLSLRLGIEPENEPGDDDDSADGG